MSTLQSILQRGTAASQPAANTVPVGTLYFQTDTFFLQRSNGSTWDSYGPVLLVGDSGSGGTRGLVPAPASGDAAAGKFLKADATWAVPASGGGSSFSGNTVSTLESTSSTTYTNLTTSGPAVTVTTGTTAVVCLSVSANKSGVGNTAFISVAVSGATTLAASDTNSASGAEALSTAGVSINRVLVLTGLTAGSNTFTMKYRVDGGTWNFLNRSLTIIY